MQPLCIQPGRKLCQEGRDMGVRGLEAKARTLENNGRKDGKVIAIIVEDEKEIEVIGSQEVAAYLMGSDQETRKVSTKFFLDMKAPLGVGRWTDKFGPYRSNAENLLVIQRVTQ